MYKRQVWTVAKNTWEKGLTYAFRDRRNKKRNFRALWIQRINAAARLEDVYKRQYYNRANVSAMLKDYRAAIVDYDKAIELNPDFADAYFNRCLLYTSWSL